LVSKLNGSLLVGSTKLIVKTFFFTGRRPVVHITNRPKGLVLGQPGAERSAALGLEQPIAKPQRGDPIEN